MKKKKPILCKIGIHAWRRLGGDAYYTLYCDKCGDTDVISSVGIGLGLWDN